VNNTINVAANEIIFADYYYYSKPMKLVLCVALCILSVPALGQDYHTSRAYDSAVRVYDTNLIKLFNRERKKRFLPELAYARTRQTYLDDKAKRLSEPGGFRHDSIGNFGEIIIQSPDTESPASAIKLWMNSPPHRAMILTKRKDVKWVCAGSYFTNEGYSYLVIRVH
jgi:hypothetical protein